MKKNFKVDGPMEAEGVRVYSKENETGSRSFCVTDGVSFNFLSAKDLIAAVRFSAERREE